MLFEGGGSYREEWERARAEARKLSLGASVFVSFSVTSLPSKSPREDERESRRVRRDEVEGEGVNLQPGRLSSLLSLL
jgi:hypothetical protein